MVNPLDHNFRQVQQDTGKVNNNPLAAPQKQFDINATEKAYKAKNDQKDKQKKRDKNGKEIEEDEEKKPLPRPMGL